MAAAKMVRKAAFNGATHTDESLVAMKTGEIASLIAAIRGGNPPKPATKARAILLFWHAAENLPKAPQVKTKTPEMPDAKASPPDATADLRRAEKKPSAKPRKAKMYSIAESAAVEGMTPQARELADAMRAAGRPLTMAEVAALLQVRKNSKRPERVVAWYFSRIFRPAGILIESRDGRGA